MPLPAESTADRAQPTGRYQLVGQARGLAQQSASFGVVGRDSHGRPVCSGAAKLRVQARGPGALRPRVVAKGAEGQYDVEFNATVSGTYELAVRAGHETLGPPTTLMIAASAACARACTADGLGLRAATAGVAARFVVVAHDEFSRPKTAGGELFDAHLTPADVQPPARPDVDPGPRPAAPRPRARSAGARERGGDARSASTAARIRVRLKDRGDGTYAGEYVLRTAGQYSLHVLHRHACGEAHIHGSPFSVRADAGPPAAPACLLHAPRVATAGAPHALSVELYDAHANACCSAGATCADVSVSFRYVRGARRAVSAACERPACVHVGAARVDRSRRHVARVSFMITEAAEYAVEVRVLGELLSRSPRLVVLPDAVAPRCCAIAGDGLTRARAGESARFDIAACDAYGNVCDDEAGEYAREFAVALRERVGDADGAGKERASPAGGAARIVAVEDGQYGACYRACRSGAASLGVSYAGAPITSSPFTPFVTPGPSHAPNAEPPEPLPPRISAGEVALVGWRTRDAHGNAVGAGGDGFCAAQTLHEGRGGEDCEGGSEGCGGDGERELDVIDGPDGECHVAVGSARAGALVVNVRTEDGRAAAGAPLTALVAPAEAHAPSCTAWGDALVGGPAGRALWCHVALRDAYGNATRCGGALRLELRGARDLVGTVAERCDPVAELGEGGEGGEGGGAHVLHAHVAPSVAGRYYAHVTVGGAHVARSPFAVAVGPAQPSPPNCAAVGGVIADGAVAGAPATFALVLRDAHGNVVADPAEGAVCARLLSPHAPAHASAADAEDATGGTEAANLPAGSAASPRRSEDAACGVSLDHASDGVYEGVLMSQRAGPHRLHLTLHGAHLGGSPHAIDVRAAAVDPTACVLNGLAALDGACAGDDLRVTLTTCDRFGNARDGEGDGRSLSAVVVRGSEPPVGAVLGGAEHDVVPIAELGGGVHELHCRLARAGDYSLHVTHRQAHVRGSPFRFRLRPPSAPADDAPAPPDAPASPPAPLASPPAPLASPSPTPRTRTGAPDPADDAASYFVARGGGLAHACIGVEATVVVVAHVARGGRWSRGGDEVSAELVSAGPPRGGEAVAACDVVDCEDGTYLCTYTPPRGAPRECVLRVAVGGRPVRGAPFNVRVRMRAA